jgi:hypothetical protein
MTPEQQAALEALVGRPLTQPEIDQLTPLVAARNDAAIAEALSLGRVAVCPKLVGDGEVALALGIPAGPLFIYQLETVATSTPPAGAPAEQVVTYAVARQAWRSLQRAALDVGNPGVRAAFDAFVGTLLTADQAAAVKSLAEAPSPVGVQRVSEVLNNG